MIVGIGTDIVRVARMQQSLDRHGETFARRILTDREWDEFAATKKPAHFLAKRFAAKEAAAKAFGTGFSDGLSLRHIGVGHEAGGRPVLEFSDRALDLLAQMGVGASHLSLADEEDYAVAFVTLTRA